MLFITQKIKFTEVTALLIVYELSMNYSTDCSIHPVA